MVSSLHAGVEQHGDLALARVRHDEIVERIAVQVPDGDRPRLGTGLERNRDGVLERAVAQPLEHDDAVAHAARDSSCSIWYSPTRAPGARSSTCVANPGPSPPVLAGS